MRLSSLRLTYLYEDLQKSKTKSCPFRDSFLYTSNLILSISPNHRKERAEDCSEADECGISDV